MRNAPDSLRKCRHGRVYDGTTCPQCREETKEEVNDIGSIENVIWRLGQPNETVRGSLRVTLANARDFLIAYRAILATPNFFVPVDGDWSNTALENWFPYSAEELERLRTENANLARALAKEVNGLTFMGEPVIRPVQRSYYPAATFKSCDANGDWHERQDKASATNMTEPTTHQMIEATAQLIEAHGREEWAYYIRLCKREIPDVPTSGEWPMKKATKCLDRCELKAAQGLNTCEQQQMCNELGLESGEEPEQEYECPIHGKLGGINYCPRC